jgi:predicted small secreted protein
MGYSNYCAMMRTILAVFLYTASSISWSACETSGGVNDIATPTITWTNITSYTVNVVHGLCERVNGGSWSLVSNSGNKTFTNKSDGTYEYRHWQDALHGVGPYCIQNNLPQGQCQRHYSNIYTVAVTSPANMLSSSENPSPDGSYNLSWTTIPNTNTYQLHEKVGNGSYTAISDASRSGKTNNTYSYYLSFHYCPPGVGQCFSGTSSNTVTVTVNLAPPNVPQAPTGPETSDDTLQINWAAPSGGPTTQWYNLQRDGVQLGGNLSASVYDDAGMTLGFHDYRVRACNAGGCSAWSSIYTVMVEDEPQGEDPLVHAATAIIPPDAVGQMSYDAGVNAKGQGTINIPMPLIPGINGIQPNLAISYNSGHEDKRLDLNLPQDTIGSGWRIGGESEIRRCTQFTAGAIDLITYDQSCLDGEPLVRVDSNGRRT